MALRQRQPWDERLPDGRTVQEALAVLMQQPNGGGGPLATAPALPPARTPQSIPQGPPVAPGNGAPFVPSQYRGQVGEERTEGLSPLGQKLAELRARGTAERYRTGVTDTGTGFVTTPPKTPGETGAPRNRLTQALTGLLHGAAMGAQNARPGTEAWSALGGAATGAATGGISPRFMEAYSRDMEKRTLQGEVATEQALELKGAQIGETLAQTEQRRAEPYLRAEEIRLRTEREASIDRDRQTRTQTALTAEERRASEFKRSQGERERHNKAMETKPVVKPGPRSLRGQFWERDDNGVMRVVPGSPPPEPSSASVRAGEKGADRKAKGVQAAKLYEKGSQYWDQAQQKRAQADTIRAAGKGYVSDSDQKRITTLEKEADGLEDQTRKVQLKGDELAAESEAGPTTQSRGGSVTEQQIRAAAAAKGLDPDKAVERARARKLLR